MLEVVNNQDREMTVTEKLLQDALELPEPERLLLANRILDSLPDEGGEWFLDDPELIAELDRRAADGSEPIPADKIWEKR
jgi:putative addiction module component (TIGR02574 family)